jgi:hypothetical protein
VLLEDLLKSDVTVEQYLNKEYPRNLLSPANAGLLGPVLGAMGDRRNVAFGDFGGAGLIFEQSRRYSGRAVLRFPQNLSIGELKTDNFVILGSRRSNPWNELFEHQLRYAIEYDPQSGLWLRDKSANAQPAAYRVSRDKGGVHETYARVALVPNLSESGSVLMLVGLTIEASEGGLALLAGKDFAARLQSTPGCEAIDLRTDFFELLLRTRAVAGTPRASELLACHPLR